MLYSTLSTHYVFLSHPSLEQFTMSKEQKSNKEKKKKPAMTPKEKKAAKKSKKDSKDHIFIDTTR